jgi:LPXTG-site transpeptidase (sortase) family protein
VLALLGLAALAVAALSLAWPGHSREAPPPDSSYALAPTAQTQTLAASTPTPAAPASTALPVRLLIPKIGVDAPVTVKGLDADGAMQNPSGPEDVAWYDFTARPGQPGNAVFSGHLDYHDYGAAVFAHLREMQAGDLVEVRLEDGTVRSYTVTLSVLYPADAAPTPEIVGPTDREMVTLVTCGGTWQGRPQGYSHRLVVRADHL